MRRQWSGWAESLAIVRPDTVVRWHRAGFRIYWNWLSRRGERSGRPPLPREVSALIRKQQLREAFPFESAPRFMIFDSDAIFAAGLPAALRSMQMEPTRTSYRSPWQNGVAERFVGTVRQELLDHVIVLNERHLRRLLESFIGYYDQDRTHLSICKDSPCGRPVEQRPDTNSKVVSLPRVGGLHHRYTWRQAA